MIPQKSETFDKKCTQKMPSSHRRSVTERDGVP